MEAEIAGKRLPEDGVADIPGVHICSEGVILQTSIVCVYFEEGALSEGAT